MHDPARVAHDATLLPDGRVLVSGGVDPDLAGSTPRPLRSAEIYDPVNESWTRVGDMPFSLIQHTGVTLPDGRIEFIGGLSIDDPNAAAQQRLWFDPATAEFTARASDPALDGPLTVRAAGVFVAIRRTGPWSPHPRGTAG